MSCTLFLDLPTHSDGDVINLLRQHGVDFKYWPRGLLSPAVSEHLQQAAQGNFDASHHDRALDEDDIWDLETYLRYMSPQCHAASPVYAPKSLPNISFIKNALSTFSIFPASQQEA